MWRRWQLVVHLVYRRIEFRAFVCLWLNSHALIRRCTLHLEGILEWVFNIRSRHWGIYSLLLLFQWFGWHWHVFRWGDRWVLNEFTYLSLWFLWKLLFSFLRLNTRRIFRGVLWNSQRGLDESWLGLSGEGHRRHQLVCRCHKFWIDMLDLITGHVIPFIHICLRFAGAPIVVDLQLVLLHSGFVINFITEACSFLSTCRHSWLLLWRTLRHGAADSCLGQQFDLLCLFWALTSSFWLILMLRCLEALHYRWLLLCLVTKNDWNSLRYRVFRMI